MNTFMNELYNAVGKEVSGYYNGKAFLGKIVSTRVKYGTDIGITVEDGNDIYIIDGTTMLNGGDITYSNLHVYF